MKDEFGIDGMADTIRKIAGESCVVIQNKIREIAKDFSKADVGMYHEQEVATIQDILFEISETKSLVDLLKRTEDLNKYGLTIEVESRDVGVTTMSSELEGDTWEFKTTLPLPVVKLIQTRVVLER